MTPLEGQLKEILRTHYPQDYLYNHELGARVVQEKSKGSKIWSFDLKDFTNRLPATLQQQVLSVITDPAIADS